MKKSTLTAIEIEALVLSTLTAPDDRRRPVSHETQEPAALRWLMNTLAHAGAGMAGIYGGIWFDPSNVSDDQANRKDQN